VDPPETALDLEAEYNNRARVPEYAEILAGWERDAAAFRTARAKTSELGIRYGAHPRQAIDLFHADARSDGRPLIVFIHGGYWRSLDPSSFSHFAAGAITRGFSVALPGYRLCPEVAVADIIEDVRSACRSLHRKLGAPLVVCGWSAGGHLAACMAATDWKAAGASAQLVRAGVAISGLFELKPLTRTSINETLGLDEAAANSASPAFWTPVAGAFESFVGDTESSEFHRQCRLIADRWAGKARIGCHIIAKANHFTAPGPLTDPGSKIVETLVSVC
jgi:arylformamidase